MADKVVKVDYLARVEGEGNLYLEIKDGKLVRVEVGIFEAPRFFEAFLRGRKYYEVPDITARVCGICPLAYIMSSSRAIEKILGIEVPEEIYLLGRIIYLGEWIESHVLHVLLLHAPDFLGYESALDMVKDHPEVVKKGLKLKGWGNYVMKVVGGRPVHPISCRVGGFYRIVKRDELKPLLKNIWEVKEYAKELLEWVLKLPIPDVKRDMEYVSLRGDKNYPILHGRVVSNKGIDLSEDNFEEVVEVEQAKYSTALRYRIKGRGTYVVGPLARYNSNYHLLKPEVKEVIEAYGYGAPLVNTFQSIIARAAEVYHAILEIEELILNYREPEAPYVDAEVKAGTAAAITEAPRGILYHRYTIDNNGFVINANIIPPTAQNLAAIEDDLHALGSKLVELELPKAQWLAEQTIRNYDPCISCSTHFLKIHYIKQ